MLTFNKRYFQIAVLLFLTEIFIAMYVHDTFVRPYFGDVLVVILMYCFLQSFVNLKVFFAAIAVLLFAFSIEFLQYLMIVNKLGWQDSKIACTVIGTSFAWIDVLAYVAGIAIVLLAESIIGSGKNSF